MDARPRFVYLTSVRLPPAPDVRIYRQNFLTLAAAKREVNARLRAEKITIFDYSIFHDGPLLWVVYGSLPAQLVATIIRGTV